MSKTLIIDPGHGGTDPGAHGFGKREKDWTLAISLYQYERLKELGANVSITRTTDKTLDSVPRTNLIKNKYDYCMSNHFNAFNGSARGVETIHSIYYNGRTAKRLADAVVQASGLPLRRVFSRKGRSGDYYFMHRLTGSTETTIVEYGFIDNKTDHDFYKKEDNFYAAAEAVVKTWCGILGVSYTDPGEKPTTVKPPKKQTGSNAVSEDEGIDVDGKWGSDTTRELQKSLKMKIVDGVLSNQPINSVTESLYGGITFGDGGSPTVQALQIKVGSKPDGKLGSDTVRKMQKYLGTPIDGIISQPSSVMVRELQKQLNAGTF